MAPPDPFAVEYFQFYEGDKMGMRDVNDRVVIPAKYDHVEWGGTAFVVHSGDQRGVLDIQGAPLFPMRSDVEHLCHLSEGRIGFLQGGLYGYLDDTGSVIVSPRFAFCEVFREGRAVVRNEHDQHGYIDRDGVLMIPFQFKYAGPFRGAYAHFGDYATFGLIDKDGKIVVPSEYVFVGEVQDGRVVVQTENDGEAREGLLTLDTGAIEWNDRLEHVNSFRRAAESLVRLFEEFFDHAYATGCPCQYPRFLHLLAWQKDDRCFDAELLLSTWTGRAEVRAVDAPPDLGVDGLLRCRVCGTEVASEWQEFNAFFAVTKTRIVKLAPPATLGAPVVAPVPMLLGFAGLSGHFDPKTYFDADYLDAPDVETVRNYLFAPASP